MRLFISRYKFVLLFIFFLSIIGLIFAGRYYFLSKTPKVVQKTVMNRVLVRRSKNLGLIDKSFTGKAIDVNTGKIVKAAQIFTVDDKKVYLELDLFNAPKGTIIDYIRYKNGRYVDHGEITLGRTDTKTVLFNWIINKSLANVRNGKWKVATYTNGILAKRVLYEINNNKISKAIDQPVKPEDADYKLSRTLSLRSSNLNHD